jgi:hypothetical protein
MTKELRQAEARLEQAAASLEEALQADQREMKAVKAEAGKVAPAGSEDAAENKKTPKAKKLPGTSRGIETMFRSAYRVQMDLTGLADNKANMMISINGIIISIIIAAVAPKLDANPWLLIPTMILLIGNLVSIVYAIQAARPRVSSLPITLSDLRHSEGNILFFGNFSNMSEDEFVEGLFDVMQDKTVVYETMIRNIYGIGAVLSKKFALLQVAYTSFMIALVMGVTSFIVVFILLPRLTG